jgi:heme/copper-type cytochrome/quinol oxidase subunit 2
VLIVIVVVVVVVVAALNTYFIFGNRRSRP